MYISLLCNVANISYDELHMKFVLPVAMAGRPGLPCGVRSSLVAPLRKVRMDGWKFWLGMAGAAVCSGPGLREMNAQTQSRGTRAMSVQ